MDSWWRWDGQDLVLAVHVQPRAHRDEVVGEHGGRLKVRLTTPPVDGKANEHLVRFLADVFGVPGASVELLSGSTGRDKRIRIRAPRCLLPPLRPKEPGRP